MMNRKQFLKAASAGALALAGGGLFGCGKSGNETKALAKNWAWMGGSEPEDKTWAEQFARMKKAGIDAVLLGQEDPAALRKIAPIARDEGLELHVWHVTMRSGEHLEAHPNWYAVNRNGVSTAEDPPYVGYYRFMSPCVPEVRDFLAKDVGSLTQVEGVEGIQLDYIRFPDVILPVALQPKYDLDQDKEYPRFDYGYHEACRAQFKQQAGVDPMKLDNPPANEEWVRFRYEQITRVVTRLAKVVHGHDKMISAAVFPTPSIARRLVRQNWPEWPLDAVMPMIYHNFYEKEVAWIETAVRSGVTALDADTPLYSGLYVPALSPDQLVQAAEHARAVGASGISLFNAGSMSDAHWERVSKVLTA